MEKFESFFYEIASKKQRLFRNRDAGLHRCLQIMENRIFSKLNKNLKSADIYVNLCLNRRF